MGKARHHYDETRRQNRGRTDQQTWGYAMKDARPAPVLGYPVCGQGEAHPETGLRWIDMPGRTHDDRKYNFFFHRRGLSVEQIVAGDVYRLFPGLHVDVYQNNGPAHWTRGGLPR